MATYYKAKYYIDGREYSVVKDGLYTLNEIKKMCPTPPPHSPTLNFLKRLTLTPKIAIISLELYFVINWRNT